MVPRPRPALGRDSAGAFASGLATFGTGACRIRRNFCVSLRDHPADRPVGGRRRKPAPPRRRGRGGHPRAGGACGGADRVDRCALHHRSVASDRFDCRNRCGGLVVAHRERSQHHIVFRGCHRCTGPDCRDTAGVVGDGIGYRFRPRLGAEADVFSAGARGKHADSRSAGRAADRTDVLQHIHLAHGGGHQRKPIVVSACILGGARNGFRCLRSAGRGQAHPGTIDRVSSSGRAPRRDTLREDVGTADGRRVDAG